MKFKNLIKTTLAVFFLNAFENFLLLVLFGHKISWSMLIGIFVFTLALTSVLKLLNVLKED